MPHHFAPALSTTPTADNTIRPADGSPDHDRHAGHPELPRNVRPDHTVRFAPSPIHPRRAYGELLALLLVTTWNSLPLDRIPGLPWDSEVVSDTALAGQLAMAVGVFFWLARLVIIRTPRRMSTGRRWGLRLGATAVGIAAVAGAVPVDGVLPYPRAGAVAYAGALVWLTLEVCLRHGITPTRLGLRPVWPKARTEQKRAVKVGGQALIAVLIAGWGSGILTLLMQNADLPLVPSVSQQDALGITSLGDAATSMFWVLVVEDLVLVGAVVALLSAARRPAWEMYAVTCVAVVVVHAYMGLPALLFLPYAWLRVRIYRRHGLLVPLIAAHFFYDLASIIGWFFTFWQVAIPVLWGTFLYLIADEIYSRGRGLLDRRSPSDAPEKRATR
ncbi:hypothetical protein OG705_29585 [Streptomyces sp. NBC_00838]|uniref:hypothetical protein n=1 Tax=Streptomyces sp. NBC_00838 TaxID=2903680 RepID=UPI00386A283C|nr:hypothetical protein OG705_29585 [Streptomyces sp. NBC_00838]